MEDIKLIYVLCPGNFKSGGPELLHQLVYQLNMLKQKSAKIAYFDYSSEECPYNPELINYVKDDWILIKNIKDSSNNIIVFPEMNIDKLKLFKHSRKYIWWMSVDNFMYTNKFLDMKKYGGLIHAISWKLKGKGYNKDKLVRNADLHLCQSYYAIDFLEKMNIKTSKIKYLSDYINDQYLKNSPNALKKTKKDVVLYNPKKGLKFTKKLIKASDELKWEHLINLTNEEVLNKLEHSKVYVDFGNHPGKDRFPREAVTCGCCVITDKKGSAKFKKDVFIGDEYKFDDTDENIPYIIEKIKDCILNYSERSKDFNEYRDRIAKEKQQFISDCNSIFINKNKTSDVN